VKIFSCTRLVKPVKTGKYSLVLDRLDQPKKEFFQNVLYEFLFASVSKNPLTPPYFPDVEVSLEVKCTSVARCASNILVFQKEFEWYGCLLPET
jgi:hypothetical protein